MTLRILEEATDELRESARWYNDKRAGLGDAFVTAVEDALEIIEQRPRQFTQIDVGDENREVRRCVLKRFPFLIVFEILAEETVVVAVAHSRRKPQYWTDRLN